MSTFAKNTSTIPSTNLDPDPSPITEGFGVAVDGDAGIPDHVLQQQALAQQQQQHRSIENRYLNRSDEDYRLLRQQQLSQHNERNSYYIDSDKVNCWYEQGQPMNTEWDDSDDSNAEQDGQYSDSDDL